MNDPIATAEDLFAAMKSMAPSERVGFFTLLGETAFEKENFSREEVFGEVAGANFTVSEAAECLEISVLTFRRYVQAKKLVPDRVAGRNQFFAAKDLKAFKRALKGVKRH